MRKVIPVLFVTALTVGLAVLIGCSDDEETVTTPQPCSIRMVTPVGGEDYFDTNPVNVRWDKTGSASQVDVHLINDQTDTLIVAGWPNSGYFPWTAETMGFPSDDDFRIRVTAVGDEDCSDQTEAFSITSLAGCMVEFPYTGKDTIPAQNAGELFTIEWNSGNTSGTVVLELWTTSFAPNYTPEQPAFLIDDNVDDTGSYDWIVSSFNFSDNDIYRFKIYDAQADGCRHFSTPFRIIDPTPCSIEVAGISTDMVLNPGQDISISFIVNNGMGLVDVRLYSQGSPVPGGIVVSNYDPADDPFIWSVNDYGNPTPSFQEYRLRAVSKDDPFCWGESERFTITR